jgi:phosphoketolase
VRGTGAPEERVLLVAVGAYQLEEALFASDRLGERRVPHAVVYLLEPGRFRSPRDAAEAQHTIAPRACADLFPPAAQVRVFLSHTRPEPLAGLLRPLDTGPDRTRFLGYVSRGGTLDTFGLLFANRCTWAHALAEVAAASERPLEELLSPEEAAAVRGAADPHLLDERPGRGRAPRADAG